MSNTDRLYSVSSRLLQVDALGLDHEDPMEAVVRLRLSIP